MYYKYPDLLWGQANWDLNGRSFISKISFNFMTLK